MGKVFHKERKIVCKMKRVQNSRGKKCHDIDRDDQSIDTVLRTNRNAFKIDEVQIYLKKEHTNSK